MYFFLLEHQCNLLTGQRCIGVLFCALQPVKSKIYIWRQKYGEKELLGAQKLRALARRSEGGGTGSLSGYDGQRA
jgi:hypothetical protein